MKMKGNDGKAARKMFIKNFIIKCTLTMVIFYTIYSLTHKDLTNEHSSKSISKKQIHGGLESKFQLKVDESDEVMDLIIKGKVHLIDLQMSRKSLSESNGDTSYSDVIGIFCKLDWKKHKEDPSHIPMFRDLVAKSEDCSNRIRANLRSVIKSVKDYDNSEGFASDVKALKPAGFVFHESRCGSTLVANSLAAFNPEKSRVYSESTPPVTVLRACSKSEDCSNTKQIDLFRDVLYIMGRTNDLNEEFLFFKFQSVSTLFINIVRSSFPHVPWIFVYRDPIEVLMSHIGNSNLRGAVCLRTKKSPMQETKDLLKLYGNTSSKATSEEFCAAYLATLCQSAYNEYLKSHTGRFVDYRSLPDSLMDDIIPIFFLQGAYTFGQKERNNIISVSQHYSKGRGKKAVDWKPDSDEKKRNASAELKAAANIYLNPSFLAMKGTQ